MSYFEDRAGGQYVYVQRRGHGHANVFHGPSGWRELIVDHGAVQAAIDERPLPKGPSSVWVYDCWRESDGLRPPEHR